MSERSFIWGSDRRFNAYAVYNKSKYGGRIQKITIDAGFTCPNRDGKVAYGGCTYCNNNAFNPSYCEPSKSISQQIKEGISFHKKRYHKAIAYMAYFQAYSNTYAGLDILKKRYEEVLNFEDIVGIVIGTRPDCIDRKILEYLSELNKKTEVIIEYGIESCYDKTLEKINRGHDFATTVRALKETREYGIRTGGHMIIGLPGESESEILDEAEILSELPVNHLKFHQLQIVKGTRMAEEFNDNPALFREFGLDEYLELMVKFLERLNPEIIIERIAGETVPAYNLRKSWGIRYDQVLKRFEDKLESKNTWQGKNYKKL